MSRRRQQRNPRHLTNEELEIEFLATRLRLTQLDDERTNRLRESPVIRGRTTTRGVDPSRLLGVRDYRDRNEIAIGDRVELRTISRNGKFEGIRTTIVVGLDHRDWVRIHKVDNPANITTRIPSNLIVQLE